MKKLFEVCEGFLCNPGAIQPKYGKYFGIILDLSFFGHLPKSKRRNLLWLLLVFGDPAGVLTQTSQLFHNQLLSIIPIKYRTDFVPNFCPVLAVQRLRFSA